MIISQWTAATILLFLELHVHLNQIIGVPFIFDLI